MNEFIKSLKDLPYKNQPDYNMNFDMSATCTGGPYLARDWKRIIEDTFDYARKSLVNAYSSEHPSALKEDRKDHRGDITVSPLILERAYYFRFFCLMHASCGDKLAQYIREYFEINLSRDQKQPDREKSIKTTTLGKIIDKLDDINIPQNKIKKILTQYISDVNVMSIVEISNAMKHRWPEHYGGEGVKPELPKKYREKQNGKYVVVEERSWSYPSNSLDVDIEKGRLALNAFSEVCDQIEKFLEPGLDGDDNQGRKPKTLGPPSASLRAGSVKHGMT